MNWNTLARHMRWALPMTCALSLLCAGVAQAGEAWVDVVWNMVIFEKANYPQSDFSSYLHKLDRIRAGLDRNDQQIAKVETDRLLKMLMVAPAADRGHQLLIP